MCNDNDTIAQCPIESVRDEAEADYLKSIAKRQKLYDNAIKEQKYELGDLVGLQIDRVDRTNTTPKILPCKVIAMESSSNDYLRRCDFADLRSIDPTNLSIMAFMQTCKDYVSTREQLKLQKHVTVATEAFHMHLLFMTVLLALNGANAFVNKQKELRVTAFSWQNCGPSSDPVQAKSLSVSPDPILVPGNLTLGLTVNVASTITNDTYAAVIVERKVGAIFVKVPCVDNLGSCTYEDACKDWASACPKYFEKYGIPCSCPIPPKTYTISDAVIDINGHLPSGGGGEYRITANLGSSKGHLGCIKVQITLKKD
ncbi:unnamed protein product [Adineta ricciae]|uniref:MD-2-related lipid-recognition domain-containing protein n=1 Tax=Adineta ricciae TaxID=249248 RepID=A0A816BXW7_ADIRI|nr:unnamed protein product [Adineta ricciae]